MLNTASEPPLCFRNADGLEVIVTRRNYLDLIKTVYKATEETPLRGTVGYSELGMHTKTADKRGIVAFRRPGQPHFAYVLLEDGNFVDGSFHLFPDGNFTVS